MRRVEIRDNRIKGKNKPRIFDLLIQDDGTEEIEVKHGKLKSTILLKDFEEQVAEAQKSI